MKKTNQLDKSIVITGIVVLAALVSWALYLGHNGVLLMSTVGILSLAIGVGIPKEKIIK